VIINKKKKKTLKLPAVMNSRFLLALLKVVTHGKLDKSNLTKTGSLLKMIDIGSFSKDPEIYSMYKALEITINCKLDDVKDNNLIMTLIETSISNSDSEEYLSGLIGPIILGSVATQEQDVIYVMNVVSTYSKVGFLLNYKDSIIDKFTHIESGSMGGIQNVVHDFEKEVAELHMKLHKTLSSDSLSTSEPISISDPDFLNKHLRTVYELSKRETRSLKLGIKKLNDMLSREGGLLTGKMYVINAPINSFKTGLLLYFAKWIQLYNSAMYIEKFKETGKRPTIVVVSLENTWDENTERLFSMYVSKNMNETPSYESAENLWKESVYKTDSIIDICMIYGKANRFSPADLEYKLDEMESRGILVIACVLDYMRIMRDDLGDSDPRIKMIHIATDLHEIVAMRPEMVLVTAHHTNREGEKVLTEIGDRGGVDKAKSLGRQHLVEANGVEDPIDFSLYIVPEVSIFTGDTYLGFKKGKCRYERTQVEYFAHQLIKRFFLTDDINLEKSLSVNSISETANTSDMSPSYANQKTGDKGKVSAREIINKPEMVYEMIFDEVEPIE